MKISVLLLLTVTLFSYDLTYAQVRKPTARPKPIPKADSPQASTPVEIPKEIEPSQKVVVEKANGDRLTGLFVSGNTDSVTVMISGLKLQIPFNEITHLRFSDEAIPSQTQVEVKPTPPAPEVETTLSFEAAIVYKMGGAQPVARNEFALLDMSLTDILSGAGLTSDARTSLPFLFGLAVKYPSLKKNQRFLQAAAPALRIHTVNVVTSDFVGKGQFRNLKPGSYWIFAYTSTRGGFAVWNFPVTVNTGANHVMLDDGNAATAS